MFRFCFFVQQIGRLSDENQQLKDKIRYLEQKLVEISNDRSTLKSNHDNSASNSKLVSI